MKTRKFATSAVVAGVAAAMLSFAPITAMASGMQSGSSSMHSSGQMAQQTHQLNVNRASALQLERIGIRPIVARNIVGFRQEHGPYKNLNDLRKVHGVTSQLLNRIQGKITVGGHNGQ